MNKINYNNRMFFKVLVIFQLIFSSYMVTASSAGINDITGYIIANVTSIENSNGTPVLTTRHVRYPVVYADFGYRCEFFLKKHRQDITRTSSDSERVYFKDVTKIQAFKGVPVKSDKYGLSIYTGKKQYNIRKWSGIASLKSNVKVGDCKSVSREDMTVAWPVFHFKVIDDNKQIIWFETDLLSIVEFAYDKNKGMRIFRSMKNVKKTVTPASKKVKSVAQLEREAREYSDKLAKEKAQAKPAAKSEQDFEKVTAIFRSEVSEGDESHCGLVIEVKAKVVKVQTTQGEYWLKRTQIYPPNSKLCVFKDGVYQEP